MKNIFLSATILSFGLITTSSLAHAQNYVPLANYGGPNVIVNMDVLDPAPVAAPTPLTQRPSGYRSPAEARAGVPLRLRRPVPLAQSAPPMRPYPQQMATAPLQLKRPPMRQITSAPLAPLAPTADPTLTSMRPNFAETLATPVAPKTPASQSTPMPSAKELVKAAEAAETAPVALTAPRKIIDPPTAQQRQRELLAKAREEVLYDNKAGQALSRMEDIAPSAAKTAISEPKLAMPSQENLEPILPPKVEAPMEMAALTQPTAPVMKPATAPVTKTTPSQNAQILNDGDGFRLVFAGQSADLSAEDIATLDQIATRLSKSKDAKIQLRAFADGTPETSSKARRLSLTRALTVRSYLLDKGVNATAMDVRALGMDTRSDAVPNDRVDIVFVR